MDSNIHEIDVAKFADFPFGRYLADGPNSAEKFRESILIPALKKYRQVRIILDSIKGWYGSSFLEETFGGLVRNAGFSPEELRSRIIIDSERDPFIVKEIWSYVDAAAD